MFKHWPRSSINRISLIACLIAVAGAGTYFIVGSHAATPYVSSEPENGTLSAGATVVADTTASSSKAVNFPSANPTPSPTTDPVIAISGDIGYVSSVGSTTKGNQQATATLMQQYVSSLSAIITPGDMCYYNGTVADCTANYVPYWGSFKALTKPSPGNHDYNTAGAPGYFGYFGVQPYYSFNVGAWHFVSLNSQIDHSAASTQNTWLKNDLASTSAKCVAAYAHYPRFVSGGSYGPGLSDMTPLWQTMFTAHGDLFFAGHSHTYERFKAQDPTGVANAAGVTEFVVGTGGASLVAGTTGPNTAAQVNNNFGMVVMTLHATSYDWKFVNLSNQVLDSGTASCI